MTLRRSRIIVPTSRLTKRLGSSGGMNNKGRLKSRGKRPGKNTNTKGNGSGSKPKKRRGKRPGKNMRLEKDSDESSGNRRMIMTITRERILKRSLIETSSKDMHRYWEFQ